MIANPAVTVSLDRTVLVGPEQAVVARHISIELCVLGCYERMAVGDVAQKWNEILQRGEWSGYFRFVFISRRARQAA